jgi:hypothetical protein
VSKEKTTQTKNRKTKMNTEIKFSSEASPLKTQEKIKRAVSALLNEGCVQHYTPEWTEAVDVTEGVEKCGYGALNISGTVQRWNGYATVTYVLQNQGSQWKNYGAPHGTKHDVALALKQVNAE